ncbi:MAG: hypothetical protein WC348_01380 [Patescibacteria group bacterium]
MGKRMTAGMTAAFALFCLFFGCGNESSERCYAASDCASGYTCESGFCEEENHGSERMASSDGNQPPTCYWTGATRFVTMPQNYFQWDCLDPESDAIAGCVVGLDGPPSIPVSRFDYFWRDFAPGVHAFKVTCRDARGAVSPELVWDFTYETTECASGESRACFTDDPTRRGIGICRDGVKYCSSGRWGRCEGEVRALGLDSCANHLDDDCDGQTDEGCTSPGSPDASGDAGSSSDVGSSRSEDAGTSSPDAGVETSTFPGCSLTFTTTAPMLWSLGSNIESSWDYRTGGSSGVSFSGVLTGREFAVNVQYGGGSLWAAIGCGINQWLTVNGVVLDLTDVNYARDGRNFFLTLNSDCSFRLRGNRDVCSGAPPRPSTSGPSPDAGVDIGTPDTGASPEADTGFDAGSSYDDSSRDARDDSADSDASSTEVSSTFSLTIEIPEASFVTCSCSTWSNWWEDRRYGTVATWSGVTPGLYEVNGQLRSGRWAAALPEEELATTFANSVTITEAHYIPEVDGQNLIFLLDETGEVVNLGPDTADFHIAGVASETAVWFGNLLKGFAFGLWNGFLTDLRSLAELGSCVIHPISCLRNVAAAASQLYAALRTEEFRNLLLQSAADWGINFLSLPPDQQAFETGKIGGFLAEQIILFKVAALGSSALRTAGLPTSLRSLLISGIISGDTSYLRSKMTGIYRALVRVYDTTRAERYFLDLGDAFEDRIVRIYKRTVDSRSLDRFRVYNPATGSEEFVDGVIVLKRGRADGSWGIEHLLARHYDQFVTDVFHLTGSREENIKVIEDIISDVLEHGTRRSDDAAKISARVTANGITHEVTVVVDTGGNLGSVSTAWPGH